MTTLEKAKLVLRITTDDFDEEITDLINAAVLDLGVAGVTNVDQTDPLINRAIMTFVKMNFGINYGSGNSDYDNLKKSYDEQKMQLALTTNYTSWIEDI